MLSPFIQSRLPFGFLFCFIFPFVYWSAVTATMLRNKQPQNPRGSQQQIYNIFSHMWVCRLAVVRFIQAEPSWIRLAPGFLKGTSLLHGAQMEKVAIA